MLVEERVLVTDSSADFVEVGVLVAVTVGKDDRVPVEVRVLVLEKPAVRVAMVVRVDVRLPVVVAVVRGERVVVLEARAETVGAAPAPAKERACVSSKLHSLTQSSESGYLICR